jgi:hypothetical protein
MSVQIEIASEADAQTLLAMMRRLYEGEGSGLPARSPQALVLRTAGFRERHVNYDLLTLTMDSPPEAGSRRSN